MSAIPLVDLAWQHRQIEAEVQEGFARVLEETAFVLGRDVAAFEEAYAGYLGVSHVIGVANGTDALELALRAAGVGPGDEVLVPANTFIATALAVARAGAKPVLVDCDEEHLLLDVEKAAAKVTPRTKAVVPVHLFGQLAPMEDVLSLAESEGLVVIEDAAQCQGARRHGTSGGAFGRVSGTSFFPGKNLGAYGDGGAVITPDGEVAKKVRALRNYGSEVKYHHPETGFNSRLDTLQAVVLKAKLERLDAWNALRREAAARYDALLAGLQGVRRPSILPGNEHVWHLYVVRVPRRDLVLKALHGEQIFAGVHYPVPVHLQGAFAHLRHREGDFPVAEAAAREMLSLPLYPGITAAQQERVVDALERALARG